MLFTMRVLEFIFAVLPFILVLLEQMHRMATFKLRLLHLAAVSLAISPIAFLWLSNFTLGLA